MTADHDAPPPRPETPRFVAWTAWLSLAVFAASVLYMLYETRSGGSPGIGTGVYVGSASIGLLVVQVLALGYFVSRREWRRIRAPRVWVRLMAPVLVVALLIAIVQTWSYVVHHDDESYGARGGDLVGPTFPDALLNESGDVLWSIHPSRERPCTA